MCDCTRILQLLPVLVRNLTMFLLSSLYFLHLGAQCSDSKIQTPNLKKQKIQTSDSKLLVFKLKFPTSKKKKCRLQSSKFNQKIHTSKLPQSRLKIKKKNKNPLRPHAVVDKVTSKFLTGWQHRVNLFMPRSETITWRAMQTLHQRVWDLFRHRTHGKIARSYLREMWCTCSKIRDGWVSQVLLCPTKRIC